ncbi:MAG: hypothetical protein HQL73_03510 [Magnetococcales bacterium]|nr:hypothetical protein [Magnetococcales bacterium]
MAWRFLTGGSLRVVCAGIEKAGIVEAMIVQTGNNLFFQRQEKKDSQ